MKKSTSIALSFLMFAIQSYADTQAFSGFYANIGFGGTLLDLDVEQHFTVTKPGSLDLSFPSQTNAEGSGLAALVGIGYSYQFESQFILGAEFTAGFSEAKVSYTDQLTIDGNPIVSAVDTQLVNDFALLFKPGYVFNNRTQIYGLVGPRWGHFDSTLHTHTLDAGTNDHANAYDVGITAGIGMIHLLTDHVTLGIEYAYTSYGSTDSLENSYIFDVPTLGSSEVKDVVDQKLSTNTVVATLGYRF